MTNTKRNPIVFSVLAAVALLNQSAFGAAPADAAPLPFVSPIFGDNMVLQRGKPNFGAQFRVREKSELPDAVGDAHLYDALLC